MEPTKTVLMTGAAGFIGSYVLDYFFTRHPEWRYLVLDALTYAGDFRNIPSRIASAPNFRFIYGDVRNAKVVEQLVAQSHIVIHFAAETHVTRSIHDDSPFFESDVIGTQRVANAVAAHRDTVERFIHISTSEVYGTALQPLMNEDHPLIPQSPYAAAKAGADRLVMAYYLTYKIPAVIIRPFNMFGPRQHLEKVIPRFITSCILGEPLTVHGTGESQRDFSYVSDLARAIELAALAPAGLVVGEVFNVGAGAGIAIRQIAELILQEMAGGAASEINFTSYALNVGDRPGQVFRHTADTGKIQRVLGWQPEVSFREGLRQTIDWYRANEDWWRSKLWMRVVPFETEGGKIELH